MNRSKGEVPMALNELPVYPGERTSYQKSLDSRTRLQPVITALQRLSEEDYKFEAGGAS